MTQPKSRTLWLIRHAKAVDRVLAQQDFDRVLALPGRTDVDDLLAHVNRHDHRVPSWLWFSPSARTEQTAAALARRWQSAVVEEPSLYLADAHTILDCLKGTPSSEDIVGLVAHNPGISDLVHLLVRTDEHKELPEAMPTLGIAQLTFTGNWPDLVPNICRLTSYLSPKRTRFNAN